MEVGLELCNVELCAVDKMYLFCVRFQIFSSEQSSVGIAFFDIFQLGALNLAETIHNLRRNWNSNNATAKKADCFLFNPLQFKGPVVFSEFI